MTEPQTVEAITRRRFLLVAAVAGGLAGAGMVGCSTTSARSGPSTIGPGGPSSSPAISSAPNSPSASSSAASSASADPSRSSTAPQALRGNGTRRQPGDAATARDALAGFGIDFLRQAMADDGAGPNTGISPYSLFTVLAMARAGANGATAAQIDTALRAEGIDGQGAVISAVDAGIEAAIAASRLPGGADLEPIVLQSANQTWVQDGFPVRQEYLDALAVQYGVEAMAADFAGDPEGMRTAINAWVSDRTNDLIPELFPDGSIDPATVLVLVNALYFKGLWALPFNPPQTGTFTTGSDVPVTTPMMTTIKPVPGVVGDGWTAVSIPYLGELAAMTVLVPDSGRFDEVVEDFDRATLAQASTSDAQVQLTMPTFSLRSVPDAKAIAEELGIVDIFVPGTADLSGIAPGGLYADAFVHQTVVKVDENGTEAAAATGMAIAESAPMVDLDLTVDRPFLFWISETTTGAPLFLGAVTDPSDVA